MKDEYERKLNDMQKEMKKLQTAKKEHSKMLRNQSQYESQIKTLRNEVTDMKKVKVGWFFFICNLLNVISKVHFCFESSAFNLSASNVVTTNSFV